jgi:dipeptidyl aminopeptidase/acylaminoacyl peptidase
MPPARALRIADLGVLPVLSDPQLSPDGRQAAYVVTTADFRRDAYASAVWCAPTNGSAPPLQLTSGPRDDAPRWSPDGQQLAFVRTVGDHPSQLHLQPVAGGEAHRLAELPGGVVDPQWSPDGTRIAVTSVVDGGSTGPRRHAPVVLDRLQYKADGQGLIGARRSHLFLVDVASGKSTQLTSGDISVSDVQWSPDGSELAFAASVGEDRDLTACSSVFVVPADGGEPVQLTPATSLLAAPTWSPDGEHLVVCGQERFRTGFSSLFVVPRAGGVPTPLAELDHNVMLGVPGYPGAQPVLLPDGSALVMVRVGGCTHLYSAAPDTAPRCLVGGPDRSLSALSVAGDLMAYLVADPGTTGELCVARLDGTGERRLTRHLAAALPDLVPHVAEPRVFTAPDGTPLQGWVLRAAETTGASPLLLDIHGGPHNAWGPALDGVHLYHHELLNRGWTVLLVNPRGSDGYGEHFYAATAGQWGLLDEDDFLAPVDALIDEGLVDAGKVVVTGYSYGGYMTCWLSARRPERWAAAIPGGVVVDLASMAGTADIGAVLSPMEFGGHPWEAPDPLRASSPLTYVQHVTAPTLILHGEHDDRCPVSQAEMWFAALRTRQLPVTLVRYPEGSHLFLLNGRPSHRRDWCTRIVEFATRHAG